MSAEKTQPPRGRSEPAAETAVSKNSEASSAASSSPAVQPTAQYLPRRKTSISVAVGGGRFWALPDLNLKYWVLCENDRGTVESLTGGNPRILIPPLTESEKMVAAERCREMVVARLRDRNHEHFFQLIKRLMLGGMLTLAGIFAMRVIPQVDWFLLAGALGYTAYAALRYGTQYANSWEATTRPFSYFQGDPFVESKLATRLAKALEYRRSLPAEERGRSPDDELLDA